LGLKVLFFFFNVTSPAREVGLRGETQNLKQRLNGEERATLQWSRLPKSKAAVEKTSGLDPDAVFFPMIPSGTQKPLPSAYQANPGSGGPVRVSV